MPWLQLRIDTDRDHAETIEDALLSAGACSITMQDNADQPILEPALGETPLWDRTRITGLFDADINITQVVEVASEAYGQPLPPHRWEQLEDKDWEREWMNSYQPIDCGHNLWICPSWLQPPNPEATNLLLDPGLAFGTGTHPTTFLCLQWLAELATNCSEQDNTFSQKTFIDFGCGSGILGIASLLLGADKVIGTDIDPQALLASRDNAQRNDIESTRFPVFLPADCPAIEADVMLANILAGPLAELAPTLNQLTRLGGRLCLSGILANQATEVMAAYSPWFDFEPVRQKEEWVCLTATKNR